MSLSSLLRAVCVFAVLAALLPHTALAASTPDALAARLRAYTSAATRSMRTEAAPVTTAAKAITMAVTAVPTAGSAQVTGTDVTLTLTASEAPNGLNKQVLVHGKCTNGVSTTLVLPAFTFTMRSNVLTATHTIRLPLTAGHVQCAFTTDVTTPTSSDSRFATVQAPSISFEAQLPVLSVTAPATTEAETDVEISIESVSTPTAAVDLQVSCLYGSVTSGAVSIPTSRFVSFTYRADATLIPAQTEVCSVSVAASPVDWRFTNAVASITFEITPFVVAQESSTGEEVFESSTGVDEVVEESSTGPVDEDVVESSTAPAEVESSTGPADVDNNEPEVSSTAPTVIVGEMSSTASPDTVVIVEESSTASPDTTIIDTASSTAPAATTVSSTGPSTTVIIVGESSTAPNVVVVVPDTPASSSSGPGDLQLNGGGSSDANSLSSASDGLSEGQKAIVGMAVCVAVLMVAIGVWAVMEHRADAAAAAAEKAAAAAANAGVEAVPVEVDASQV